MFCMFFTIFVMNFSENVVVIFEFASFPGLFYDSSQTQIDGNKGYKHVKVIVR